MTHLGSAFVGIVVVVLGFASAAQAKKDPVALTAEDQKWVEVPDSGGVTIAPVVGIPQKGAYQAFTKFPAGSVHALHTHSSDMTVVVISGNFLYGPEGGPEKKYGGGSFLMIPGNFKHTGGCDASGPCLIFQEQPGKFDIKVTAAAKAASPK